jgi:hypothetical protein
LILDRLTLIFITVRQERYEESQQIFEEFLLLAQEMNDQDVLASGIHVRGILAVAQGQARQAARLLGIAEQMALLGGFTIQAPGGKWLEHLILDTKARLGEEAWAQEYQVGQEFARGDELTMEKAIAFAFETSDE